MSPFYVQSLFIFFGIFSLLGGVAAAFYFSRLDSSARYWVVATLLTGMTNVVTVFREVLPPLWSYSIPIGVSGAGFALMGLGIQRLYNQGPQRQRLIALGAGTAVFIVVMEWARVNTGPTVTLLLSGGIFGLTSLWGAYFAHVHYRRSGNRFSMHMRWIMLSLGILHLLRTQGTFTGWGVNTFGQEGWTYGIWTGAFVMGVLRYFAYVAIRLQENNEATVRVATALARQEEGRRLDAQLARLERQQSLGVMSASFAHELNQPLAAILNYAELLQDQLKSGTLNHPTSHQVLEDIITSSVRAGDIIRRIRHFIQPAALKKELVDLRTVVIEVCALVEPEARRANIAINKSALPPEPIWVLGDPVQLSQVLFNVVRNAMEAVAGVQNPKIYLLIRQEQSEIVLEVHDNGSGLSPEAAEQVGDPFYTTKISGMGMGLSISKTILAQFGGHLSLENKTQGVCARITLPLIDVA